jgi:O-Antigen ligase
MSTWIALLPAFIAIYYLILFNPEKTFLNIYIPILLLLPQMFTAELTFFHNLNFSENAIVPIGFATFFYKFFTNRYHDVRFGLTDLLIPLYAGLCLYSEYHNTKTEFLIPLFVKLLTSVFFPYFLGKYLIHERGLSSAFAKRFVFLIFIDVLISFYEMRFGYNPYTRYFSLIFPGQATLWVTMFRYDLVRIAGPFAHPILFGLVIGVAVILNYWLIKSRQWSLRFKYLPPIPYLSKGTIIMIILAIGLVSTYSRGPLLSTFLGLLFASMGFVKERNKHLIMRFSVILFVIFLGYHYYEHYLQIQPLQAKTETEYTAAYRAQLYTVYQNYIFQKPYWGWGYIDLPTTIEGSIDNQYLWLTMKHGIVTLAVFILILITVTIRLLFKGMKAHSALKTDISLSFSLAGAYIMMMITMLTVFMGLQTEPVFFIITGWAEGLLLTKPSAEKSYDNSTDLRTTTSQV